MRFLGQRDDVATLLAGFDLFCLSSRSEGFPNVVGEAMACAVPCVTTDVGDAAELVGETGWVVPPRAPEALAVTLHAALLGGGEALRHRGEAARARIKAHFSLDAIVGRYLDLYRALGRVS
jgi:glycosyltransferase involved in cell wall biosynthesis